MATSIGPKIGIDGEREYRDAINNIIQQGKTLDAQMRAVAAGFDASTASEEDAAKQTDLLNQRIETQQIYVQQLADMVSKASEQTGENSTQTLKWKEALANAEGQLATLEGQAEGSGDQVEDLGQEMEDAGQSALSLGDLIKANVISEAIIGGFKALASAAKEFASAMVDTVKDSAAYADNILTLSTNTGLSTETLQEFQYMAELTDTSVDTITGSLTKLTRNMDSARGGTGAAAEAFKALGVDITDSNGELRSNEAVFMELIDALGRIPNATERDAMAMSIFGKSAQDLNSLIKVGSDGIAAYAREAREVGYVLDGETLDSLGAADDAFQRLDLMVESAKNNLGAALAPAITEVAGEMLTTFTPAIQDVMGGLAELFSGDSDKGIGMITEGVGAVVDAIAGKMPAFIELGGSMLTAILQAISANLPQLLEGGGAMVGELIAGLIRMVPALISMAPELVVAVVNGLVAAWPSIKAAGGELVSQFGAGLSDWWSAVSGWGKDMIDNFINGIVEGTAALWDTIKSIGAGIRDFLGFSEPDKGPLSDFHTFGPDMMKLYAKTIADNAWRVQDAVSSLALEVDATLAGIEPAYAPTSGGYSMNMGGITVNIYDAGERDNDDLVDEIMYRMQLAVSQKQGVFS